ncbi:unnamed protein product [Heligmosomoides polygyrus]|uniref:HTH_48 domain-containing protein n=1 Tax=Heligmosomoides polygyrus TaxID=6339 RepID=A0A183G6P7_HELPZ|nr:unnamed protein product [Heligmosomoides polygyrus]
MMTLKTRCEAKNALRCSPVDDVADVDTESLAYIATDASTTSATSVATLASPTSVTGSEKIVFDCKQVRLLLLYVSKKQSSAGAAVENMCGTMGPHTVSCDTAKVWFLKFKNGLLLLGRPTTVWKVSRIE